MTLSTEMLRIMGLLTSIDVMSSSPFTFLAIMFEKVAAAVNPDLAAKWIRRELARVLNYNKKTLDEVELNETHLIDLLTLIDEKKITDAVGQKILEKLVIKPFDVKEHVKKEKLGAVSGTKELEKFCKEAIKENPKAVEDFKKGEAKALHFLMGKVMQKSRGKAKPDVVLEVLKKLVK